VVFPFGLWWQWFANVWPATEFEAQFCGGEALAALTERTSRLIPNAI
jgi:hypothetical protein